MVAASVSLPASGQSSDDDLKIYAAHVVKTTPLEKPFTGFGIYLGDGAVITAFHVIGRAAFLKDPHVLIAGQNLPATIIKEGSLEQIDLTLLSIEKERLPINLRLRRNPLCKQPPWVGENVVGVVPEQTQRYQIISPLLIAPDLRKKFNTLISKPAGSGSGIFNAEKRCLLGIASRQVAKFRYRINAGKVEAEPAGLAGYFISAARIADFLPQEFRF